ncbi:hypothetical protein [Kordiimonas pumila]|uniref:Uncharacterized protein n=1 Tax=Kordiimonas pumila TaxID=2161677 RepID=A0ABV7D7K9_9PROT|nr:hypothetical protein [Kordiimonas pumila]
MTRSLIRLLTIASFIISLLLLLLSLFSIRVAAENREASISDNTVFDSREQGGPILVVPVFPKAQARDKTLEAVDLRDSYIILEDGATLSMADWILGGLKKDTNGAAMSDYESRLFLGQVARAMAGMSESLVSTSLIYSKPTVSFTPTQNKPIALQGFEGLVRMLLLPGTAKNWTPATTGGAFADSMKTGDTGPVLFESQLFQAMNQTVADFKEAGAIQAMIEAQERSKAQ